MKRWGRFVLIFFAYGIALLHTAVPHHHAQVRTGESVIAHTGCIFSETGGGLLQRVLSTDLGAGHLEIFKKGGDTDLSFAAACVFLIIAAASVVLHQHSANGSPYPKYVEKLKRRLLLSSVSQLRAPPVF